MHRYPATLVDSTKAYVEATSLSVRFLIVENEFMAKELQATKQGEEKATASAISELRRAILDEVSSLETVMWKLYFRFVPVHNSFIHLNGWQ